MAAGWRMGVSVVLGGWALAGRFGDVVVPVWWESEHLLLLLSHGLALVAAVVWTVYLAVGVVRRRTGAAPMVACGGLVVAFVVLPLGPVARALDDGLHGAAREEIVRRVEAGELRPLNPPHASLVPQLAHPRNVSDGAGQRMVDVRPSPEALQVVFFPYVGLGNGRWWVGYRSDDRPPARPGDEAFGIVGWERMRAGWFRGEGP